MRRRRLLHLIGSAGAVAVAGCVGGDEDNGTGGGPDDSPADEADDSTPEETPTPTPEEDDDSSEDDDPPEDEGDSDGDAEAELGEHEYDHPGEAVEAFVTAWQEGDVEATNTLIYEDGELEPQQESDDIAEEAPGLETIESPEVDGDTATVETLLLPPEQDDPFPVQFELTQVDGAWLLVDLVSEIEARDEIAPTTAFETDFDDGEVEITHTDGESIPADELYVRGDGFDDAWYELADDVDADEDVAAGMTVTIEVGDEYSFDLVWDDGENSATLFSVSGASDTATDQSPVDSHLENTENYDGSVEDFTGEDEVVVQLGDIEGHDQMFVFDPPAIRVDEGTTVVWEWVGDDAAHNVVEVDGAFESDIKDEDGATFSHTFEESDTYLYVCQPHRALAMKGAVVVE